MSLRRRERHNQTANTSRAYGRCVQHTGSANLSRFDACLSATPHAWTELFVTYFAMVGRRLDPPPPGPSERDPFSPRALMEERLPELATTRDLPTSPFQLRPSIRNKEPPYEPSPSSLSMGNANYMHKQIRLAEPPKVKRAATARPAPRSRPRSPSGKPSIVELLALEPRPQSPERRRSATARGCRSAWVSKLCPASLPHTKRWALYKLM